MVKNWFKKIVVWSLEKEARLVLRRYRPRLVGITGSVGKTSTKELIALALGGRYHVRASQKSFNSELGLPLTVLGLPNAWLSFGGWLRNLARGLALALGPRQPYPAVLVLEVGLDRPGDIRRATRLASFEVAVLTRLPEVPVHVEFFSSVEALLQEKMFLAQAVPREGAVVLNYDDPNQEPCRGLTVARVLTAGFEEGADWRGGDPTLRWEGEGERLVAEAAISFKQERVAVRVPGLLAREQWRGVLAALAVAEVFGIEPAEAAGSLRNYEGPPGRLKLLRGLKDSLIIDDTYNSSPAALEAALQALKELPAPPHRPPGRRIAVLGDMLELGPHTADAHEAAGVLAARSADLIIGIGLRAKFLVNAAAAKRFKPENLLHFIEAKPVGPFLQNEIRPGDVVLIKGSQSMRLERVVEEVMAEPEHKEALLVRQELEWQNR